jgi:hypothetical protein
MDSLMTSEEDTFRYKFLLDKLYATLDRYDKVFPELGFLRKNIEDVLTRQPPENSYNQKLMALQLLLKEKGYTSYIIRHLSHNFSQDVVLFQNGMVFQEEMSLYLQIP